MTKEEDNRPLFTRLAWLQNGTIFAARVSSPLVHRSNPPIIAAFRGLARTAVHSGSYQTWTGFPPPD